MDLHALVNAIVRQVLEQLEAQGAIAPQGAAAALAPACRPRVKVLAEREAALEDEVMAGLGAEADICFWGEDWAGTGTGPDRFILPRLSCPDMADLASGRASGPLLTELLRLLLSGREVEVMNFEYRDYGQTAPGPLYGLYEGYEKTLAGYGMVAFRRKQPEVFRLRADLITEESVSRAGENGASVLEVPLAAIVTPLARDAAKTLNINIIKRL